MTRMLAVAALALMASAGSAQDARPIDAAAFLRAHCFKCHGETKKSGGVRLDELPADPSKDGERWLAVRDQIRDGLMPPAKEPRPSADQVRALVSWITSSTGAKASHLPNLGNQIPHELLFAPSAAAKDEASPTRFWRLGPEGYKGLLQDLLRGKLGVPKGQVQMPAEIIPPFNLVDDRGIRDFAGLYSIDEPTTEVLLRNSAVIVDWQVGLGPKTRNPGVLELSTAYRANPPSRRQLDTAVQTQFRLAIGRTATREELDRYWTLYEKGANTGDHGRAVKTVLQAVLLKSDAIFRSEMGGQGDAKSRRMLAPTELAQALSLALGNRREPKLWAAAEAGNLATKEEISDHVKRLLDDASFSEARVVNFFHEYFEYHRADDVFKDKPKDFLHEPKTLIKDTDQLVAYILAKDKDVFRQLLITELSFVSHAVKLNKKKEWETGPAHAPNNNNKNRKMVEHVYGFEKWPSPQPVKLAQNTRMGILMQPSWLIAWGTNFDNDPVRRGRWIRERLLGGTVPDLPIGVAAQIPDDPKRTLRDRLKVTREAQCWKCHQRMDDLGMPFEQFDHFGRFRTTEEVQDAEPKKNPKGKVIGVTLKAAPLDTTGLVTDSGDTRLDGAVKDPREMIRRIAESDRARQVFVRHVFRYFMGRNETLSDARTLQEADRAYVASGGSFKALVHSLLTSDVFLYRHNQEIVSK